MSYQQRDKLEGGLRHLTQSIAHTREAAGYMTASEFAALWFSLLLTAKRIAILAAEYREWLRDHVFDGRLLDTEHYLTEIRNCENILRFYLEKNIGAQKTSYTKEEQEDQLVRENTRAKFGQIEYQLKPNEAGTDMQEPTDTTNIRKYLLQYLSKAIASMYDCLDAIARSLSDILDHRHDLFGNAASLAAYIKEVEDDYLRSQRWEQDKLSFIIDMRNRLGYDETEKPSKPVSSYQYHLAAIINSMDDITRKEQAGGERARLACLLAGRDTIDEDMLYDHLRNRNCLAMLQLRIASFDWVKPPVVAYAKLFPYVACMDMAKAIAPYIAARREMKKYHYAVMKMAFDDFGLTLSSQHKNAGEWIAFVNTYITEPRGEKAIQDNGSITKVTGNLYDTQFKTLSPDNLQGTTFREEDFKKYEELYAYCVHTINSVMKRDLKEAGFSQYWIDKTKAMPIDMDIADMERLQMQASVLKGDCLRF